MGDYADDAIDMGLEIDYLTDNGTFERLGFEDDPMDGAFIRRKRKRRCSCKFCGKTGLHWERVNGGWRLATSDGEIHSCLPFPEPPE